MRSRSETISKLLANASSTGSRACAIAICAALIAVSYSVSAQTPESDELLRGKYFAVTNFIGLAS
jgi:hypothetical protein